MSNDYASVDTEEYTQDEEVNCVFCGKLFPSIERVQEHISQCHESVDTNTENIEPKIEATKENKPLRIYDLNTELIMNKVIDYNGVVQCSKCDLLFVNTYASRMHFEKVHLGKKRKRSSNPKGVEGIIVCPNGSDNWGCDICDRQFPTMKQAKVHKFKSHIEPVQKNKLPIHRKTNISQRHYVKKFIAENKFREILPCSKKYKIEKSLNESGQHINHDGESGSHGDPANQGHNTDMSNDEARAANIWRAAEAGCRGGNKIVIKRVYQNEGLSSGVSKTKYGFLQRAGYSCFYCREVFINKENFRRHLQLHRYSKGYKCSTCGSKFSRVRALKQHQRHACHAPSKAVNIVAQVYNGVVVKNEEKTMEHETPQIVRVDRPVVRNIAANFQAKDDEISPRDIKFAEKFLNNSSITLNKGSQCVCNLCQSCFYSNHSILKHLVLYHRIVAQDGQTALAVTKSSHVNVKPRPITQGEVGESKPSLHFIHNCEQCGSQFASSKGLQRHLHSVHMIGDVEESRQGEWTCDLCGVGLQDEQSLEAHKVACAAEDWSSRSANGVASRVKCDLCPRRFKTQGSMEEHRRLHVNDGVANGGEGQGVMSVNVKAELCVSGKGGLGRVKHRDPALSSRRSLPNYGSSSAYKKAKVPPNTDGLFECDVCHKTFTCRSSLSNHVKSHFNFKNKPFSCSSCHQGFMSTLTLQHHRERLCPNNAIEDGMEVVPMNAAVPTTGPMFPGLDGATSGAPSTVHYGPSTTITTTTTTTDSTTTNGTSLTARATSCMHCSAMFPDRSLLEDHASKEHSNHAGEVVCIICPRSFTTYMAFRVHMTKSHGGPNGTSLKSHLSSTSNHLLKTATSMDLIQELSASLATKDHNHQQAHTHSYGHSQAQLQPISQAHLQPLSQTHTLVLSEPNGMLFPPRHACPNCDKDFSTSQALGNHKRACMPHLYKKVSL